LLSHFVRVCYFVGIFIIGTYEGTSSGIWSGAAGYVATDAMYIFQFVNMQAEYYVDFMNNIEAQVAQVGQLSYSNPLPVNLLYW
jgi:hypothetical protein